MRHSPFLSELHPACGFAGHGPQVSVRLLPVGHASVKLISALESAGVNQTCHTIRQRSLPRYGQPSHFQR
ncbi:MAG: sporulation protein YunB [Ruminococcus callidus]